MVSDAKDLKTALDEPVRVWFDYAGTSVTPPIGMEVLPPGGQLMLVSVDPSTPLGLDGTTWLHKELDIQASCGYSEAEYAQSIQEITGGSLDMATVFSGVRSLEEGEAAFAALVSNPAAVKIQLAPLTGLDGFPGGS